MERQIIFDQDEDTEGLMYDLDRANSEGLKERLEVDWVVPETRERVPVRLTDETMEAFLNVFDFGVNIGPGDQQNIVLEARYVYDYGRVEEPTPA